MGNKGKKNKTNSIPKQQDEFDVKSNINKLRKKSGYSNLETDSYSEITSNTNWNNSEISNRDFQTLSDSFDRYDKLRDSFNSEVRELRSEISTSSKDLRDEIKNCNQNIIDLSEKKLSKSSFNTMMIIFIAIISSVIGLVYALSYSKLISDSEEHSSKILKIENSIVKEKKEKK